MLEPGSVRIGREACVTRGRGCFVVAPKSSYPSSPPEFFSTGERREERHCVAFFRGARHFAKTHLSHSIKVYFLYSSHNGLGQIIVCTRLIVRYTVLRVCPFARTDTRTILFCPVLGVFGDDDATTATRRGLANNRLVDY